MHDHEVNVDVSLVRRLILQQFPGFGHLDVKQIVHSGTDNAIFRLGDEMCIRLPRIDSAAEQLDKEIAWLPKLSPQLNLTVPIPLYEGVAGSGFPYRWYIYQWIEGSNAYDKPVVRLDQLAEDLALFICEMHTINVDGAPCSRRGADLVSQDNAVRQSLKELAGSMDVDVILCIWDMCVAAPLWDRSPVWLHGDLLPSNLLMRDDRLQAVIDFGLMGIGDPACDLIPAWAVFDKDSRHIFRDIVGADEATWLRGKGWALSIALIAIPYYLDSNPVLVSVARRMIAAVVDDMREL